MYIEDITAVHGRTEIRNFSSSVEKYFMSERSEQVNYFSTREEKFRISKRSCNVLFIINTSEMPNHFTFLINFFLAAKGAMYHVAIATVIFLHVKITCYFHM